MSPASTRRISSGSAFNSEFISTISIIEHSSTISTSPSSGFSLFFWYPSGGLHSKRRCIVLASIPVASVMRFAALPVGAARSIFKPCSWYIAIIPFVTVVLPVPGPPVSTRTFDIAACFIASACNLSYLIFNRSSIFVISVLPSRFFPGRFASLINLFAVPVSE